MDYLSAKAISNFNMFTSEVEQENSFLNRIKNKIKVLQMYSSSPANDLFYVGSSFDNTDYIEYSKIESTDVLPTIDNGQMTLSKVTTSAWVPQRVFIEEASSNGVAGNNHSVYASAEDNPPYRYFFQDSPTSRSINNVIDNIQVDKVIFKGKAAPDVPDTDKNQEIVKQMAQQAMPTQ